MLSLLLQRLFLVLFFVYLLCLAMGPADEDMDLGWQIAQGRWIVQNQAFYRTDALNYPNLGQPVVDEYPIFQVAAYFFSLTGPYGTTLLRVILVVAIFVPLLWAYRSYPLREPFLLPLAVFLNLILIDSTLRAQLVSSLFANFFFLYCLTLRREPDWRFILLFPLQIIWVNCHSGFILGPLIAVAVGSEWILGELLQRRVPTWKILSWCLIWLSLSFACLINPYGADRLSLPVYQERLAVIRQYVTEMMPLSGDLLIRAWTCVALAAAVVFFTTVLHRRRVSWAVLVLAFIFLSNAMTAQKHWPFFMLCLPLAVLSSAILEAQSPATAEEEHPEHPEENEEEPYSFSLLGNLILITLNCYLVSWTFQVAGSNLTEWHRLRNDLSVQPSAATDWLTANHITGKIMNRAEIGGWLQEHGPGLTFCDAGLGKFSADYIRQIAMLGDRPGLLPAFLGKYPANMVVCGNIGFNWPSWLRKMHWRLVFYSPNSSVWVASGTHMDLPEVPLESVIHSFEDKWPALENADPIVKVRALIALHGTGCPQLAAQLWHAEPADFHLTSGYWNIAILLCQDGGWDSVIAPDFVAEAQKQNQTPNVWNDPERQTFLAFADYDDGKDADAQAILEKLPPNDERSTLLLKIYFEAQNWTQALELAEKQNSFDVRNGERWEILAQCLEHANRLDEATNAWTQAVLTSPDVPGLVLSAEGFLASHPDDALKQAVEPWKDLDDPDLHAELEQIIISNIRRLAEAPNVMDRAIFGRPRPMASRSNMPIKIILMGTLDNEDQHARVLKVAKTFCPMIIDSTTIKKP